MAKLECTLSKGTLNAILSDIEDAVFTSVSATKEDESNFSLGGVRCAVRVYERYSYMGGNRVSLNLTLLESDGITRLSAITSGGSQAMFFKINTLGEDAFLDTIRDAVDKYR